MSNLQRRQDTTPARTDGPRKANPLKTLPQQWRKPVALFFGANAHLLRQPLTLSVRIGVWIQREGLTLDELMPVLDKLMQPECCAKWTHGGELLADFAAEVGAVIRRRKAREETEARRKESETFAATPPLGFKLADLFRGPLPDGDPG